MCTQAYRRKWKAVSKWSHWGGVVRPQHNIFCWSEWKAERKIWVASSVGLNRVEALAVSWFGFYKCSSCKPIQHSSWKLDSARFCFLQTWQQQIICHPVTDNWQTDKINRMMRNYDYLMWNEWLLIHHFSKRNLVTLNFSDIKHRY